jgi:hypothetical protein
MGLAVLIVYMTLGRRRIDFRFILVGAVLPDVVDAAMGLLLHGDGSTRRWAHSLTAVIVLAVVVILGSKGERRLAIFGLPVGWLLHLVGDAMWNEPRTFLWPLFGTGFDGATEPWSLALFTRPLAHLGLWGMELAGLAVLAWFWIAFRLAEDNRAKLFLSDGYLRP